MRLSEGGAVRIFEDVISGAAFDRPGLAALLDYARPGDTLMIIRLDRLGRSLKELLETRSLLKEQGVNLVSLEERIDTISALQDLVAAEKSVFAAAKHLGIGRSTAYKALSHSRK